MPLDVKVMKKTHVVIIVEYGYVWAIGIKSCYVCNPIIWGN